MFRLVLVAALVLACAAPAPAPSAAAPAAPPSAAPAAGDPPVWGPGSEIEELPGAVQKVSEEWYGLVPDADPGTRFAPDSLPEEFRQDGLRVVFSGVVGEIPPNVRMWGTPLRLTSIRRE